MLNTVIKLSSLSYHAGLLEGMTPERARDIAVEAAKQGVVGWVLARLKEDYQSCPGYDLLKNELFKRTLGVFAQNQKNISIINELYRLLNAEGIEMILLKGSALMTSYYPQTTLRQIGDIDVWIDVKDIYRARDILVANGAESTDPEQSGVVDMKHHHLPALKFMGQTIELHHRLFDVTDNLDITTPLSEFVQQRGCYKVLGENAMFYHLVTHAYQNTLIAGLRIGWIVDIAYMLSQSSDMMSLINFIRNNTQSSDKEIEVLLHEIIGMTMPFLTDAQNDILLKYGFEPKEFNAVGKLKTMSKLDLKYYIMKAKLLDFRDMLRHEKSLKGKLSVIKNTIRYEMNRTRSGYPGDNLFVALFKRTFGKGIAKRHLE